MSKQKPSFRFYSLYDKISRGDILQEAYLRRKRNGGAPGIDGITFKEIEGKGLRKYLSDIAGELQEKRYKPMPVKRVHISKGNGKTRPLGIACIRDRIVQTACKLVIEPIFEPHLHGDSYGYRPKRSAQEAAVEIEKSIKSGFVHVYDADLSKYFDSIPHRRLMEKLSLRISDKEVLKLIKGMIKSPIAEETNGKVKYLPSLEGVPQGSCLSPLMANVYLNDFCLKIAQKTPCKIITYADDFVILHRMKFSKQQLAWFSSELAEEGLTINQEKTKVVNMGLRKEEFCFLGFVFKMARSFRGRWYLKIEPSRKARASFKEKIRYIVKHRTSRTLDRLIFLVNRITTGWCNYFRSVGYPRDVFFKMDWFVVARFYKWARKLSQRRCKRFSQNAWEILRSSGLNFLQPCGHHAVKDN